MTKDRITCEIQCERSIDALARNRAAFSPLRHVMPNLNSASHWEVDGKPRRLIEVLIFGKTGYGKSTLLNILTGFTVFGTSDIEACTRKMQSAEFRFTQASGHCALSFTDLPGLGESSTRDAEYLALYKDALANAHAVVYVLRADQRDFSVDESAFDALSLANRKRSVTLALTCIDKIEPTHRTTPFHLSASQAANLERKLDTVQAHFGLQREQLVPVAAIEGIGLDQLATRIMSTLSPHMQPSSTR